VWYCSGDCQRRDWKQRHRTEHAWNELSALVTTANIDQVQKDYYIALDHVESLTKTQHVDTNKKNKKLTNQSNNVHHQIHVNSIDQKLHSESKSLIHNAIQSNTTTVGRKSPEFWNIFVEDMTQLHCLQILLRAKHSTTAPLSDLEQTKIQFLPPKSPSNVIDGNTYDSQRHRGGWIISVQHPRLPIPLQIDFLPPQFDDYDVYSCEPRIALVDQDTALSIRWTYSSDHEFTDPLLSSLLKPHQIQSIACRHCHQHIFLRRNPPDNYKILPLPSGQWSDMQEYLMCYAGPIDSCDFGPESMHARPHCLLENETMFVAHIHDIQSTSTCVLNIPGYGKPTLSSSDNEKDDVIVGSVNSDDLDGSAEIRGTRHWCEAVGGETLTCSLCASILGFAVFSDPNTYRFLKHQLVLVPRVDDDEEEAQSSDSLPSGWSCQSYAPLQSIASFVANEMVRYAETKAIFTFAVAAETTNKHTRLEKCLILRLVSWDTMCVDNGGFDYLENENAEAFQIRNWNRLIKIVFEETAAQSRQANNDSTWTWTTADWCCSPTDVAKFETSPLAPRPDDQTVLPFSDSCVRLQLSDFEYQQLKEEILATSRHFPREVVEATVMAKLGPSFQSIDDVVGLAGITAVL
jgi:hypothetical protein